MRFDLTLAARPGRLDTLEAPRDNGAATVGLGPGGCASFPFGGRLALAPSGRGAWAASPLGCPSSQSGDLRLARWPWGREPGARVASWLAGVGLGGRGLLARRFRLAFRLGFGLGAALGSVCGFACCFPLLWGGVNWIVDLADFGLALGPPSRRTWVRWGVGVRACGDELGAVCALGVCRAFCFPR